MFGVTTDYCLLLVSRYREELHFFEDKHDAMARAVTRTGPTILASGLTVSLAMLTLMLADAQLTSTLGPVAAIGVSPGCSPGSRCCRRYSRSSAARASGRAAAPSSTTRTRRRSTRQGVWRRVGDKVLERPGLALAVTVVIFVAGSFGILAYKVDYSTTNFFKKDVDSVEGFS